MSAYIVEDKTINRIVSWMFNQGYVSIAFLDEIKIGTGMISLPSDWEKKLGQMMRDLNVAAVESRYNEREEVESYHYTYICESDIQVLKSLTCWMYQCCEDDIPKTPLYKFFSEFIEPYLMRKIIANLPEYDKAEWA